MDKLIDYVLRNQSMNLIDTKDFYRTYVARFDVEHSYETEIKLLLELFLTYPFDPIARHYMLTGLSYALNNAKNSPPDASTRRVIEEVLKGAVRFLLEYRHSNLEASIRRMLLRAMERLYAHTHEAVLLRVIGILSDIPQSATINRTITAIRDALRVCSA